MRKETVGIREVPPQEEPMGVPAAAPRRTFFAKYSDPEKAGILWKVSLALTVFSIVLCVTGLFLDRYDLDDEVTLNLEGHPVIIPSISIRSTSIRLGSEGCDAYKVDPSGSALHSGKGITFSELAKGAKGDLAAEFFVDDGNRLIANTHMGEFSSYATRGLAARILAIISISLQGIALVWMVVFKVAPSPFFFNRPLFSQSRDQHVKGAVAMLLLMSSGVLLFASNVVVSTFVVPLMARVVNFALDWCAGSPFDAIAPRQQAKLEYMLFMGRYIQEHGNATGVTFISYAVGISLIFFLALLVTYLGILHVRALSRVQAQLPKSQLHLLSWYCRIWDLKYSLLLLVCAIIANCATAYSARVRGYELNIYFYNHTFGGDAASRSWSLRDFILDSTHQYVMDKSLVKMLTAFWVPVLVVVGAATVDYTRYMSKVVQSLGMLILGSAIVGIMTVPPTPAFVLQKPQCFEPPHRPPTFTQFFSVSESCNDQLYSLYSVLIMVPVMMAMMYVRYGAVRRKKMAMLALVLMAVGSGYILVATRQQYTVDVYIGTVVSVMFVLSQAAALKLLFRFGVVHPGMREKKAISLSDKVVPGLDDVIKRLELHFMAGDAARPATKDEVRQMRAEFERVIEAVAFAKQQSLEGVEADGLTQSEPATSMEEEEVLDAELVDDDEPFDDKKNV